MYQSTQELSVPFVDLCSWVFDDPKYDLDKPIYIDPHDDRTWLSYRLSLSYVRRLVAGLRARGLQPGDSVCLHSFNSIWYSMVFLATIGAQGRFVGSNTAYTAYELEHLFTITETRFVLVSPDQLDRVWPAAKACNIPDANILVFNGGSEVSEHGLDSWRSLLEHGEEDWYRFNNEDESKNTTAMLASTSGTTGPPKAAVMPHHTFVAQSKQTYDSKDKLYEVRRLFCLAQFHLFPVPLVHVAPLKEGHTTYILKRWNLESFIGAISRFQITETAVVTPIVRALLALLPKDRAKLSSLRAISSAGAPLAREDQNKLRLSCHAEATFTQVWGLTECGWITCFHYPEDDYTGSVGRLMPGNEARIIDADGHDVMTDGMKGELIVRGPALMLRYLGNEAATKNTIRNGWFHTGDIGYQIDGKWYIVDRVKELIKVRGWQVSPTEVEQCLYLHPGVHDAAVIGIDFDDGRGELPRAYIVPTPGQQVSDEKIMEFMAQRLASYKALSGGIVRTDTIPRNPSGKILRRVLRDQAMEDIRRKTHGEVITVDAVNDQFTVEAIRAEIEQPVVRISV